MKARQTTFRFPQMLRLILFAVTAAAAGIFPLGMGICDESVCSWLSGVDPCSNLACTCSVFSSVGPSPIENCIDCKISVHALTQASEVYAVAEGCGLITTATTQFVSASGMPSIVSADVTALSVTSSANVAASSGTVSEKQR